MMTECYIFIFFNVNFFHDFYKKYQKLKDKNKTMPEEDKKKIETENKSRSIGSSNDYQRIHS